MSITADQLNHPGRVYKELIPEIQDWLQLIDEAIAKTPRVLGRNTIEFSLPTVLASGALGGADARRMLYSAVIHNLERRGFKPRVDLGANRATLYITWTLGLSESSVKSMDALISAHSVRGSRKARKVRKARAAEA